MQRLLLLLILSDLQLLFVTFRDELLVRGVGQGALLRHIVMERVSRLRHRLVKAVGKHW